jgi:hypothetical protein
MSHNPYLPDELQEEPVSLLGMLSGLILSLGAQAALVIFLVLRVDVRWDPPLVAIAIVGCWMLSYVIGMASHNRLATDRQLDPDKMARRHNLVSTRDDAAGEFGIGIAGALLQFFCGSVYHCVRYFLGQRR